jgi:hypothetical protein
VLLLFFQIPLLEKAQTIPHGKVPLFGHAFSDEQDHKPHFKL